MRKRINWKDHIEKQKKSGQSVPDYCRSHGLSQTYFYATRKKLKVKPDFKELVILPDAGEMLSLKVTDCSDGRIRFEGHTTDPSFVHRLFPGRGR